MSGFITSIIYYKKNPPKDKNQMEQVVSSVLPHWLNDCRVEALNRVRKVHMPHKVQSTLMYPLDWAPNLWELCSMLTSVGWQMRDYRVACRVHYNCTHSLQIWVYGWIDTACVKWHNWNLSGQVCKRVSEHAANVALWLGLVQCCKQLHRRSPDIPKQLSCLQRVALVVINNMSGDHLQISLRGMFLRGDVGHC